jgi:O-antigen ligase
MGVVPTGREVLEGSPIDSVVYSGLLFAGLIVLGMRLAKTKKVLSANGPILAYFGYCLVSVLWAIYPDVAFRKWLKDIGDLVMPLVLITDGEPIAAFQRLLSRTGFVLLPCTVLFMKYFDGLGFDEQGNPAVIGVTSNKNTLGVFVLLISLGTFWRILQLLRDKNQPGRQRHLIAQGTLLTFGLSILMLANSATCIACFPIGASLIFATSLPSFKRWPARVHGLMALLVLGAVVVLLGGGNILFQALGRKANFTGRTDIWEAVFRAAPNPIFGAGYESYWITPEYANKFAADLLARGWWRPETINEAHNGYIEIFLNLGFVGLGLIALIFIRGYRQAYAAFRQQPQIGGLLLAYLPVAGVYSVTEAGFRLMNPIWIYLLLAVAFAGGIANGSVKTQEVVEPGGSPVRGEDRQPEWWGEQSLTR